MKTLALTHSHRDRSLLAVDGHTASLRNTFRFSELSERSSTDIVCHLEQKVGNAHAAHVVRVEHFFVGCAP